MTVTLHLGDCLSYMRTMEAGSVDAVITDLPYGTTACSWDVIIPFAPMWEQVKRICKGAFVTTASQPFTSMLIMSNLEWFKYEWIWDKVNPSGFQIAKFQPMKQHENILVFGNGAVTYNPIRTARDEIKKSRHYGEKSESNPLAFIDNQNRTYTDYLPKTIISFSNADRTNRFHPTQKTVALYDYLIRTYTNAGETVLDIATGSGTTGVAAVQLGRNFIGCEIDPTYFAIAEKRIAEAKLQPALFQVETPKVNQMELVTCA